MSRFVLCLKRLQIPAPDGLVSLPRCPRILSRSFKAVGTDNEQFRFEIYQRQNLLDNSDYSCGIAYISLDGSRLTLARYNGPEHQHGDIFFQPHIHRATAESIASGKKPEREAEETETL